MKLIITLIALMASTAVNAGGWDIVTEFGAGLAPMPKDGTYWQDQREHKEQMASRFFSLGLAYKTDSYNIIGAYDDLGQRQIWTYGYPDNDYSALEPGGVMPGDSPCGGCEGYFYTQERLTALRFAVSTPDSMSLYAEAGLIIYKSDLRMDLIQITEGHNHITVHGDGDPLVGMSVAFGYRINDYVSMIGRYYRTDGDSGMPVLADDVYVMAVQVKW